MTQIRGQGSMFDLCKRSQRSPATPQSVSQGLGGVGCQQVALHCGIADESGQVGG